ncbi:MAG: recombination protein RecO [Campylobacterota bacterium]|nr:recombination protein RecO [Campylobacterota bacterium]
MQGFIIKVNRYKDEDLIVTIITQQNLQTLYRFYGARHSVINLGFKIDFEVEKSLNSTIARLRDVIHLGHPWITDRMRLSIWQQFSALFYPHLKDAEEIGDFYFEILDHAANTWHQQNPKRIAIESYIKILKHEGRLHEEFYCFHCEGEIETNVSLLRAFLPSHPECSHRLSVPSRTLKKLYVDESTLFMSDKEVSILWNVLIEGL